MLLQFIEEMRKRTQTDAERQLTVDFSVSVVAILQAIQKLIESESSLIHLTADSDKGYRRGLIAGYQQMISLLDKGP